MVRVLSERYRYYRLTVEEKRRVIDGIVEVLRAYHVELAVIFGSFVELDSFRDIDVAVYKPGLDVDDVIRLSIELEERLGMPVDVVPLGEVDPEARIRILTRGLVVLEGRAGVYEYLLLRSLDELALMRVSV